jgi:sterol desaturase/sphingolipid hydroxylase (fatty acid hydroxylase superfamily)
MYYFYLYFIFSYALYSTLGLLNDIFIPDSRIKKLDINKIKESYEEVSSNVATNVLKNSIPLFILSELMYVGYDDSHYGIFRYLLEYIVTLIGGINLDYLIHKFKHSELFYKYHKEHHSCNQLFSFMAYYGSIQDFCLSMIVVIFPSLFRFNPQIVILWIFIIGYKQIIFDHSNIYELGKHYNIHYNNLCCNYGIYFLDELYETCETKLIEERKKNDSNECEKSDDESDELDNLSNEEKKELNNLKNKFKCYEYLVKATPNIEKPPLMGKLHYSNFF